MKTILALFALVMSLSALAEKKPIEYYQPIIDAEPFGPPPPGFDPNRSPNDPSLQRQNSSREEKKLTQEQEKLKASITFSVINKTDDGSVAVGFTDSGDPKSPRHYYLKVGEESDDWKVEAADAAEGTMTLVNLKLDIDPIELSIGSSSGGGGGKPSATGAGSMAASNRRLGLNRSSGGSGSLLDRRRSRELARQESEAAEAKRQADAKAAQEEREAKEAEEKAQREAEREEQRAQLEKIKEELQRVREEKKEAEEKKDDSADSGSSE